MASFFDVVDEWCIFVGLVFSGLFKSLFPGAGQFDDDDTGFVRGWGSSRIDDDNVWLFSSDKYVWGDSSPTNGFALDFWVVFEDVGVDY